MTSLPLLSSISALETGDFETLYPVNLEPVAVDTKISKGYLRTAMGASVWATGPGIDRAGICWGGTLYRVMGSKLVSFDSSGVPTVVGDVGDDGLPAVMDYGFGRLAINSSDKLWYYDGGTLSQVTDPDLGPVKDVVWMDGYYITTDGQSIVVTDLSNPFAVNPLKYGSAEADPDQIIGLGKLRGELIAFGSSTIQFYNNAGTAGFPFQTSVGATIPIGIIGRFAKVQFAQTYAFVGGGRNQAIGVWLMAQGSANKISTRAIDDMLMAEPNKSGIQLEARVSRDENRLYVHLSDKTLVYLAGVSALTGTSVWYICRSGLAMDEPYRLRNAVNVYDKLICGDTESAQLGVLSEALNGGDGTAWLSWSLDGETFSQEKGISLGKLGNRYIRPKWRPHLRFQTGFMSMRFRGNNGQPQFGDTVGWSFQVGLLYNQTQGAIVHDIELVGLPARQGLAFASCEARIEPLGA